MSECRGTEQRHYFTDDGPDHAAERRGQAIEVRLAGREVRVATGSGVFSAGRLDLGTRVLLRAVPDPPQTGHLLDLGCGWGPIALSMSILSPQAQVWAVDVTRAARELTAANAAALGLRGVRAVRPDDVPADVRFDAIWSNPPIRIGKPALHELLARWLPRLRPASSAHLVVQRNLGADSLIRWLNEQPGFQAHKHGSAKGFRVIAVTSS